MRADPIAAVMVHVTSIADALAWYQGVFPEAALCCTEETKFQYLNICGVQLEPVLADEKVCSGPSGTVVYWKVDNFASSLAQLQGLGARLYRGPMQIEGSQSMCQLQDPWGNCFGIRGPSTPSEGPA